LHEREEAIAELQNERQYALDNLSHLENNIRQRDEEIADLSRRNIDRESEAEKLREATTKLQKERDDANDQARSLQEMTIREAEALERIDSLLKENADSDVLIQTLKERVAALHEELARLRRQVHDLQQESADKEVRLTQFTKLRDQDKEDIKGLNIALDSKQQELELVGVPLVHFNACADWKCR
jgi:chromosome segregation ATPase